MPLDAGAALQGRDFKQAQYLSQKSHLRDSRVADHGLDRAEQSWLPADLHLIVLDAGGFEGLLGLFAELAALQICDA